MRQVKINGNILDCNLINYKYLCVRLTNGMPVAFRIINNAVVSFNSLNGKIRETYLKTLKDCAATFLKKKCSVLTTNEIEDVETFMQETITKES